MPSARKGPAIRYEKGKLNYEGVINFEYNRAEIRTDTETRKTLGEFEKFLNANPGVKISVEGHTDSRGSDEYNPQTVGPARCECPAVVTGHRDFRRPRHLCGQRRGRTAGPGTRRVRRPRARRHDPVRGALGQEPPRGVPKSLRVARASQKNPRSPEPEPEEKKEPPAKEAKKECEWLFGPRLGVLGPNSWVNLNGAVQPCLDWLELSLGVGLGLGNFDAESAAGDADGSYWSLTVPIRARVYFFDVHAPILDVGIGFTHYNIDSSADDGAGNDFDYSNTTTPFIAHAGLGYGYRPNGPGPGLRLGIMLGLLFHLNDLAGPDITADPGFPAASATELRNDLNDEADKLAELEPYGELSVGWMF